MAFTPNDHHSTSTRDVVLSIRARSNQRELIDKAADALGKNRSDFMLEASCREAENVLLDRRYFTLSEEQFKAFTALLDSPPKTNAKLRKLLAEKAPWE
ncbi:MAG: DUF1778 domain-containing protein [Nitrospirae bacterium]|nr:DUF1778 domain-containing protein [Nitrospirota bacterium]